MLTHSNQFASRRSGDTAERLEILAADLIDLNAEGDARRSRLLELGWSAAFLDEHESEARGKANGLFVRDISDERPTPILQMQDAMVDIMGSLFPSTQFLVAELQARGIPKHLIDLHLRKAKARAALKWIHEGMH